MKFTLYTANCTGNEKEYLLIMSVLSMRILPAVMPNSCCMM